MDRKLIELLICPVTQGKLELDNENQALISKSAQLVFPIRDGIPILLESEGISLKEWNKKKPDEVAEYFAKVAKQTAHEEAENAVTEENKTSDKASVEQKTSKE